MPCTRERWRSTRSSASPSGQSSSDGAAPGGAGPPGLDRPRVQAAGLRSLAGRDLPDARRLEDRGGRDEAPARTDVRLQGACADRHRIPQESVVADARRRRRCSARAGDRFPWLHLRFRTDGPREDLFARLNDTRFNLLVFGQPAPSPERLGFGEVLEVHAVPSDPENAQELARVSISGPAYYPLRPDGHIGLAGTRFDDAAPKRWFSMAGVRSDASGSSHKLDGLTVRVTGAA
jgi:hypothetical protein